MPVGFGFSVGDVVTAVKLVRDISRALRSSKVRLSSEKKANHRFRHIETGLGSVASKLESLWNEFETQEAMDAHDFTHTQLLNECESSLTRLSKQLEDIAQDQAFPPWITHEKESNTLWGKYLNRYPKASDDDSITWSKISDYRTQVANLSALWIFLERQIRRQRESTSISFQTPLFNLLSKKVSTILPYGPHRSQIQKHFEDVHTALQDMARQMKEKVTITVAPSFNSGAMEQKLYQAMTEAISTTAMESVISALRFWASTNNAGVLLSPPSEPMLLRGDAKSPSVIQKLDVVYTDHSRTRQLVKLAQGESVTVFGSLRWLCRAGRLLSNLPTMSNMLSGIELETSLLFLPNPSFVAQEARILASKQFQGWERKIRGVSIVPEDAIVFGCCYAGDLSGVRSLLDSHKASPWDSDPQGYTPLHVAAYAGHKELCTMLLRAGADVDEVDIMGRTPLMLLCRVAQASAPDALIGTFRTLIELGEADTVIEDQSGYPQFEDSRWQDWRYGLLLWLLKEGGAVLVEQLLLSLLSNRQQKQILRICKIEYSRKTSLSDPLSGGSVTRTDLEITWTSEPTRNELEHTVLLDEIAKVTTPPVPEGNSESPQPEPLRHRCFPMRLEEDKYLLELWNENVLPSLSGILASSRMPHQFVTLIRQGKTESDTTPIIQVQSSVRRTKEEQRRIGRRIAHLFPTHIRGRIYIQFKKVQFERSTHRHPYGFDATNCNAEGVPLHCMGSCRSRYQCNTRNYNARNRSWATKPSIGSSIGVRLGDVWQVGTLGAYICLDGRPYALTAHHVCAKEETDLPDPSAGLAEDAVQVTSPAVLEIFELEDEIGWLKAQLRKRPQPLYPENYKHSLRLRRNIFKEIQKADTRFGTSLQSSGYRNRPNSHTLGSLNAAVNGDDNYEMDWALIKVDEDRIGQNSIPKSIKDSTDFECTIHHSNTAREESQHCTQLGSVTPGNEVHCIGRTTAFQRGIVNAVRSWWATDVPSAPEEGNRAQTDRRAMDKHNGVDNSDDDNNEDSDGYSDDDNNEDSDGYSDDEGGESSDYENSSADEPVPLESFIDSTEGQDQETPESPADALITPEEKSNFRCSYEWTIIRSPNASVNQWNHGGAGLGGDSGAGIIDSTSHELVGLLWARIRDDNELFTIFTPVSEIVADIQERLRGEPYRVKNIQLYTPGSQVLELQSEDEVEVPLPCIPEVEPSTDPREQIAVIDQVASPTLTVPPPDSALEEPVAGDKIVSNGTTQFFGPSREMLLREISNPPAAFSSVSNDSRSKLMIPRVSELAEESKTDAFPSNIDDSVKA